MSWEHLGVIWDLVRIWEASGHLGSGTHLEESGKHLGNIREASTLGFPPWSERCLLETPGVKIRTDHQFMFFACFFVGRVLFTPWKLHG